MYLADSDSDAELGPQDEEGTGHDGRRELAPSEHSLNEGAWSWSCATVVGTEGGGHIAGA